MEPPSVDAFTADAMSGYAMELLELVPSQLGVGVAGVYVIDDDGACAIAGPFKDEDDALAWIRQTQESRRLNGDPTGAAPAH
jgi:hypothetical protein